MAPHITTATDEADEVIVKYVIASATKNPAVYAIDFIFAFRIVLKTCSSIVILMVKDDCLLIAFTNARVNTQDSCRWLLSM